MKTFKYRWKVVNSEHIGQKDCEDEPALRDHVEKAGGELVEIIEVKEIGEGPESEADKRQDLKHPGNPEMIHCNKCGTEVRRKAVMCPSCGTSMTTSSVAASASGIISDEPCPDWAYFLTCCCTPVAGIILYFIWKDERPKAAKEILPCMIWSIVIYVILVALSFLLGAIGGFLGAM